ncbi:nucleoside hydrolase [Ahniella affigens]|uniref:Nucleoside hydrolase n=1 Tax=Ahniella affigens TaxID=2021234 RepID=A0A2P1PXS5_9GAMM|nr:nucleoside hydrolase [Ahniella affigens]AVP99649.1 nucleoside hydrolase [Ahniella affigens]
MEPWLIDTDPGVDDALAILAAHRLPNVRVLAMTIAAGNVGIEHTVQNALKLTEVMGVETPVYVGAPKPLVRPADDAAFVHGLDGFGDIGYRPSKHLAEAEHAVAAMIRLARQHAGKLNMIMLGPLTNLALALSLEPELPNLVKRLVIMGGAVTGRGNTERLPAEFNTGFDAEAAHIVFSHWPSFDLVDWEATMAHGLPIAELDQYLAADHDYARFYRAISRKTRTWMSKERHPTHWFAADALAMAAALWPEHVQEWQTRGLKVELEGRLSRGATLVDWTGRMGWPKNARIMMRYSLPDFGRFVGTALGA